MFTAFATPPQTSVSVYVSLSFCPSHIHVFVLFLFQFSEMQYKLYLTLMGHHSGIPSLRDLLYLFSMSRVLTAMAKSKFLCVSESEFIDINNMIWYNTKNIGQRLGFWFCNSSDTNRSMQTSKGILISYVSDSSFLKWNLRFTQILTFYK